MKGVRQYESSMRGEYEMRKMRFFLDERFYCFGRKTEVLLNAVIEFSLLHLLSNSHIYTNVYLQS